VNPDGVGLGFGAFGAAVIASRSPWRSIGLMRDRRFAVIAGAWQRHAAVTASAITPTSAMRTRRPVEA